MFRLIVPLNDDVPSASEMEPATVEKNGGIKITESERLVLEAIKSNPFARNEDLVKMSSLSSRTVDRSIRALREKGLLKREGAKKNGHWEIVK